MNFYLFIYVLASSLVQRVGLGNKKNMLPQRNKEGKKKREKQFNIFVELSKIYHFGTFLQSFSCLFFSMVFDEV